MDCPGQLPVKRASNGHIPCHVNVSRSPPQISLVDKLSRLPKQHRSGSGLGRLSRRCQKSCHSKHGIAERVFSSWRTDPPHIPIVPWGKDPIALPLSRVAAIDRVALMSSTSRSPSRTSSHKSRKRRNKTRSPSPADTDSRQGNENAQAEEGITSPKIGRAHV